VLILVSARILGPVIVALIWATLYLIPATHGFAWHIPANTWWMLEHSHFHDDGLAPLRVR
jgi:hypothetical protein